MTSLPLPYTTRNIWFAALLLAVLLCYLAYIADLMAGIRAHNHRGYEGEAAGLGVALLMMIAFYTAPFAIGALVAALQRGSKPVSVWVLLLGLLPSLALAGLVLFFKLNAVALAK